MWREKAVLIACEGESLTGILHSAETPNGRGMLLIVGGPQYRAGSHRQFVEFARDMAATGTSVLRFDYRGMGDSSGPYLDFEQISKDVGAALDELVDQLPELTDICVFGLCDAASSALMFSAYDPRVTELILLNPWVRSEATEAQAVMKHYYGKRLFSGAFWRKLFSGEVKIVASMVDAFNKFRLSRATSVDSAGSKEAAKGDFRKQMLAGAQQFEGRVLLVLSGNDFTANEFEGVVSSSGQWTKCVNGWTQAKIAQANHTFSRSDWKQQLGEHARNWMNQA